MKLLNLKLKIAGIAARLMHEHGWTYDGINETGGKESHWYWHFERCECGKSREVLNSRNCACGGRK